MHSCLLCCAVLCCSVVLVQLRCASNNVNGCTKDWHVMLTRRSLFRSIMFSSLRTLARRTTPLLTRAIPTRIVATRIPSSACTSVAPRRTFSGVGDYADEESFYQPAQVRCDGMWKMECGICHGCGMCVWISVPCGQTYMHAWRFSYGMCPHLGFCVCVAHAFFHVVVCSPSLVKPRLISRLQPW